MSTIEKRLRKKPARHQEVIWGAINERLLMLPQTEELEPHRTRLEELLDELRRSLAIKNGVESDE